ncbi:MAG: hypothetical protein K6E78_04450 [Treponema sp.]|nr:hypothetical protein [Treponema sp.]
MRLLAASDEWKAVKKSSKEDFRLSFDTAPSGLFRYPLCGLKVVAFATISKSPLRRREQSDVRPALKVCNFCISELTIGLFKTIDYFPNLDKYLNEYDQEGWNDAMQQFMNQPHKGESV